MGQTVDRCLGTWVPIDRFGGSQARGRAKNDPQIPLSELEIWPVLLLAGFIAHAGLVSISYLFLLLL